MHIPQRPKIIASFAIFMVSLAFILAFLARPQVTGAPSISMTAETPQQIYHLRQTVTVTGTFRDDGTPVPEALVAMDIRNPLGQYFAFRTVPIGNPDERWDVEITEARILNQSGDPIDKAKINSVVQLSTTVHNTLGNHRDAIVTATMYDGNLIPICTQVKTLSLSAEETVSVQWTCFIPEWAYDGKATVHYNVFDNYPIDQGIPYSPEKTIEFYITRNLELEPPYPPPKSSYTTSPGYYNVSLQVPPDRSTLPGNYAVYVTGRISALLKTHASTTFEVQSVQSPPQAAFTYSPLKPYQNMTVNFDASSSSAEGFNDTIIRYEWTINDPYNPRNIIKEGDYTNPPDPHVSHTFEYAGTYVVDLNVTDTEGLWSTTSKPVKIMPEFGPTANFTWTPESSIVNATVSFDASSSTSGWSAKTQEFSPIVSYIWNFADGTGNITETDPLIDHVFTDPGNFTVRLTIVDAVDRTDTTSHTVEVQNTTLKDYDLTGDGQIDGRDVFIIARAFGTQPGDELWNPVADVNGDGKVDGRDLFPIKIHFGEDP